MDGERARERAAPADKPGRRAARSCYRPCSPDSLLTYQQRQETCVSLKNRSTYVPGLVLVKTGGRRIDVWIIDI